MGEYEAISFASTEASTNSASKPAKYCYTRIFLLSFAEHETCRRRPENLDPVLWRDSPPFEVLDGGVAIPLSKIRAVVRRDRESDVHSNSPQEVPEWRKDSWRPGSSGSSGCGAGQQSLRRKAYDEEVGSTFSTSYPPRPAASGGENGHLRNFDRTAGPSASGQARWEHRLAAGDRDRERRLFQDLDSDDLDIGNRSFGFSGHSRSGWVSSERDGLLGSGGGPRGAFTSGLQVHTSRYNGNGRNGRSNEQYQLPKQAKPASNLRRDETDFVNDETFGIDEPTTEERAEQERKRRESFELMRKQHLRQVQELKERHPITDELTANKKNDESGLWDNQGCLDARAGSPPQSPGRSIGFSSESSTSALPTSAMPSQISTHSSTPRPAVPPGFAKAMPSRISSELGNKERNLPLESADSARTEATDVPSVSPSDSQNVTQPGICLASSDCSQTHGQYRGIEVASPQTLKMVKTSTASYPPLKPGKNETAKVQLNEFFLSNTEEQEDGELKHTVEGQGSVCNEPFVEVQGDDNIPVPVFIEDKVSDGANSWCNLEEKKVSNLAQWFDTKETPGENILSLFSKTVKSVSTPKMRVKETSQINQVVPFNFLSLKHESHVLPMPAGPSLEDVEKGIAATDMDDVLSVSYGPFQPSCAGNVTLSCHVTEVKHSDQSAVGGGLAKFPPVFLTCQDIELSIIAEAGHVERNLSAFPTQPPVAVTGSGEIIEPSSSLGDADGTASHPLMSLLRRRPLTHEKSCSSTQSLKLDLEKARDQTCKDADLIKDDIVLNWVSEGQDQGRLCMQPTVAQEFQTLESLFGKAFMNELRAQDKPVSMKTCSDQVPFGEDMPQLPLTVSHFRQSEAGSSKPTFGTIGRASRPGASDARDVRVPDLCRRKPTIQSCDQDLALPSPHTGEQWPSSYLPSGDEAKDGTAGIVIKRNGTENQKTTCTRQAYGSSPDKTCDSTGVVQTGMNHNGEVGQGCVCFGENVEKETNRNGDAAVRVSSAEVEAGHLPTTLGNRALSAGGGLGEGAQEQSVAATRSSVEWKAFQGGGVVKSTSADRLIFFFDTSFDDSSGGGLEDRLSKANLMEATSGPDFASGGYSGGHQFRHRATTSPQFKVNSGQSHQSIGYSGFQPQLLQQPQAGLPVGVLYRPLSPPVVGLHSHSTPVHHQLQQPLMSQGVAPGGYLGFPHPPYQSPQPQQQMLPQFGSGGAIELPHFGFRPVPDNSGRSFSHHGSASGSLRFRPPPGHLSQQGAGYHMRPVGPVPNHFVGAAHGPQRSSFFQVMNAGPFIQDHPLHEPTISLAANQGQAALPLFAVNGSSPHSGPNAMVHQPGHNGRAGPPGPHLAGHPSPLGYVSGMHYVSDSGHASKGQDFSSYPSNNGKVGGIHGVDRWHGC